MSTAPGPESAFAARYSWALGRSSISQNELAARVGMQASRLSEWATGATKQPRAGNVAAVAEALGVSASWLRTGEGEAVARAVDAVALDERLTALERQVGQVAAALERMENVGTTDEDIAAIKRFAGAIRTLGQPEPTEGQPGRRGAAG